MSIRVNGVRYQKPPVHTSKDRILTRNSTALDLGNRSRTSQDSSSIKSNLGIKPLVPDVSFINHTMKVCVLPNFSLETIKPKYEQINYADSSVKTVEFRSSPQFNYTFEKGNENHDVRVKEFMCSIGCEEFIELFQANQIQYEDLEYLDKDDLIDMGLPIGPRNRILRASQALDKESLPSDSQPMKSFTPILHSKNIQNAQNIIIKTPSKSKIQHPESPTEYNYLRYEVDNFMKELSMLKTNRHKVSLPSQCLPLSPYSPPVVPKFGQDSMYKLNILFKDIAEKQSILLKDIQQNSYLISVITDRIISRRSSPIRKDGRKGRSLFVSPNEE